MSPNSRRNLQTCHIELCSLFFKVDKYFPILVIEGHRGKARQNRFFREGRSKLRYPDGNHNRQPSLAVDAAPHPLNWNDRERFTLFAGYVMGMATARGIKVRWGGDWDQDFEVEDNRFDDLVHFELVMVQ